MRFVAGLVVGVVVVLAAELLFVTLGGMPVAALDAKPLPLERFLAGRALDAASESDAGRQAPIPADAANLLAGAKIYREHCIFCHGAPGEARRAPLAEGMFPRPPRLMPPAKGVTDDPVGETYWKVKHGIRLSGMPSFARALGDTALWQVSLLVAEANHLPDAVRAEIR